MATDHPSPRLSSDTPRYWLSLGITSVLAVLGAVVAGLAAPEVVPTLEFVVSLYFGTWIVFCTAYSLITWGVLNGVEGTTLADWLRESRALRRRRQISERLIGSGGVNGAISFCVIAVASVSISASLPELRGNPLVIGLAVLVVAASWQLIVTVYAVHYAREQATLGGLEFRGTDADGDPQFSDFVYLAVQVGTAYASSGVEIRDRGMRRVVTAHCVIAFVFNTVIIALLVSLLLSVGT